MNSKTLFITGGSSGFGHNIAKLALEAGYNVVATFRKTEEVEQFSEKSDKALGVHVDITNKDQIKAAVETAIRKFESIDVLVNNAGYGEFGVVEAIDSATFEKQFGVNVQGLLDVTQAVLPYMREKQSGHIINFSSIGGITSMPLAGIYCASKFAVEGLTAALSEEVKGFGIKTTLIEPGAFDTKFGENSTFAKVKEKTPDAYESFAEKVIKQFEEMMGDPDTMGDPEKLAALVLYIIKEDIDTLHVPIGKDSVDGFKTKIEQLQKAVDQWEEIGSQMSNSDTLPSKLQ